MRLRVAIHEGLKCLPRLPARSQALASNWKYEGTLVPHDIISIVKYVTSSSKRDNDHAVPQGNEEVKAVHVVVLARTFTSASSRRTELSGFVIFPNRVNLYFKHRKSGA